MYMYPPPCPCGTKWSDRMSTGILWIVELTSFNGPPPRITRICRKGLKNCFPIIFRSSFWTRFFVIWEPRMSQNAPKIVPKSTPNGAQVHSQRPPWKDLTNFVGFHNFLVYFPKRRHA